MENSCIIPGTSLHPSQSKWHLGHAGFVRRIGRASSRDPTPVTSSQRERSPSMLWKQTRMMDILEAKLAESQLPPSPPQHVAACVPKSGCSFSSRAFPGLMLQLSEENLTDFSI